MKKLILILFLFCLNSLSFAAQDTLTFSSPSAAQRYYSLISEIRCLVCQGENIADSNATLATDLRTKVYNLIAEKKTDAQIKEYLVHRYGEFILFNPRLSNTTLLLWGFPFTAVGLLLIFFGWRSDLRARQ